MTYSDLYTASKNKSPRILILVAILAISAGLMAYIFTNDSTPTKASQNTLSRHEIVNLASNRAGILWSVDTPDKGSIIYGTSQNSLDSIENDTLGEGKRTNHFAQLNNLEPNTTYYYKILSNNGTISDDNGKSFSFKTIKKTQVNAVSPAYGTVINPDQTPSANAIVILYVPDALPLVDVTSSSGEWLIPLQNIIDPKTFEQIPFQEDKIVTMSIYNEKNRSTIRSLLKATQPVPQSVILGNNYSFIEEQNVLSEHSQNQNVSDTPIISIRYPVENSTIPSNKPLVKGLGVPGEFVNIEINAQPTISGTVVVSQKGTWQYSLARILDPGRYVLTMKTVNSSKRPVELARNFVIAKSGEQVLGESDATPSATLTPSVNPSVSPAISPTTEPTVIVINQLSVTPSPIESVYPSATPAPPVSGIDSIPWMIAGFGITIVGVGLILLL